MLPKLLFWLTLLAAGALIALVLVAPSLASGPMPADGWRRVVGLFADDATVRRISLFAAVGLVVSACVFFRRR